jgi:hypothetical protein
MAKIDIQEFGKLAKCNQKKDLNERIEIEKWVEMFKDYFVNNFEPEEEIDCE